MSIAPENDFLSHSNNRSEYFDNLLIDLNIIVSCVLKKHDLKRGRGEFKVLLSEYSAREHLFSKCGHFVNNVNNKISVQVHYLNAQRDAKKIFKKKKIRFFEPNKENSLFHN